MKNELILLGNIFKSNKSFKDYVLRNVDQDFSVADTIHNFDESDKELFLTLERVLKTDVNLLIITSKSSFSLVGKLLCTITLDNQVLKESMLIPSKTTLVSNNSYLLEYNLCNINVILASPQDEIPKILLQKQTHSVYVQLFNESIENAKIILEPIAQTYDVHLSFTKIVDGFSRVEVNSSRYGNISLFLTSAKQLLSNHLINSSNIVAYIIEILHSHGKKITFAESCTGGLLAYAFTKESGASSVLDGSLVSYSNALKENWLGVSEKTLIEHGAVSEEVVQEMSEGAINVTYADYAISLSGIAGPSGAVEGKPIGTVCISVRSEHNEHHETFHFKGDRNYVQEQSVFMAIKMLISLDEKTFFTI